MFSTGSILIGALLVLVQLVAALPWLAVIFFTRADLVALRKKPLPNWLLPRLAVAPGCCLLIPAVFRWVVQDRESLEISGRVYAGVLQLQLTLDLFVLGFAGLLAVWPKGAAVALAAFREGVRQWMFWLLLGMAAGLMFLSIFIPYFTF